MMRLNRKAAVVAIAAALGFTPSAVSAACGDLNNDTNVNVADVSFLLTCVVNPSSAACGNACGGDGVTDPDCGDVNGDGSVNIADAVVLLARANGQRTILPLCTSPGSQVPCGSSIPAGTISSNQVWGDGTTTCEYLLDGLVFVDPGTVLTVRAGTIIRGARFSANGTPSALIFRQGDCAACEGDPDCADFTARINAAGTPSRPIVFTSDQPAGARAPGDWAGLAFNGCASINAETGEADAEGLVDVTFGGGTTPIEDDFSGIVRYTRVEYAGRELAPDNELNVFTMNAIGSDTELDHIQAHVGLDDGFEWFGGTVIGTYLVASGIGDDSFDWQLGTTGGVQYGLIEQSNTVPLTGDPRGFEGDGNENGFDNGSGTGAPGPCTGATDCGQRSNFKACNVTSIGDTGTAPALVLRRGTSARLGNILITGWDEGLQLRDNESARHFCIGDETTITSLGRCTGDGTTPCDTDADCSPANGICLFGDSLPGGKITGMILDVTDPDVNHGSTSSECNSTQLMTALVANGHVDTATDPGVSTTFPNFDPRPTGDVTTGAVDCPSTLGIAAFESTTYIGAFDPNGDNWLETPGDWINFDLQ